MWSYPCVEKHSHSSICILIRRFIYVYCYPMNKPKSKPLFPLLFPFSPLFIQEFNEVMFLGKRCGPPNMGVCSNLCWRVLIKMFLTVCRTTCSNDYLQRYKCCSSGFLSEPGARDKRSQQTRPWGVVYHYLWQVQWTVAITSSFRWFMLCIWVLLRTCAVQRTHWSSSIALLQSRRNLSFCHRFEAIKFYLGSILLPCFFLLLNPRFLSTISLLASASQDYCSETSMSRLRKKYLLCSSFRHFYWWYPETLELSLA